MKKVLSTVALVLCAVMVLSVVVSAQPGQGRGQGRGQGGPGGPGGFGGFGFGGGPGGGGWQGQLNNPEFRSQLGLTDEQVQKIEQIRQDARPAGGQQRGPEAGPPSEAERAAMTQRRQETQDKIRAVLTAEQQEKAKVLVFQVLGGLGSANAAVLEVLDLTDDQKAKLTAINEELADQRREIFAGLPGRDSNATPEERQAAFRAAMAKNAELNEAKVKPILTDEQKAKAEKLTAEGEEIRERFQEQFRQGVGNRGGNRQGGAGAIPNSWEPGQGGRQGGQGGQPRRNFPRSDAQ